MEIDFVIPVDSLGIQKMRKPRSDFAKDIN